MDFITRIRNILFNPNGCWSKFRKEGIREPIMYLLGISGIGSAIYFIIGLITIMSPVNRQRMEVIASHFGLSVYGTMISVTIIRFAIFFIASFLNSALLHLFAKLFKGGGSFSDTYKSVAYGMTPHYFLLGVPYLNRLSYIYMIYLQVVGLSNLHNIKMWKAVVSLILADILLLLLIFVPIGTFTQII